MYSINLKEQPVCLMVGARVIVTAPPAPATGKSVLQLAIKAEESRVCVSYLREMVRRKLVPTTHLRAQQFHLMFQLASTMRMCSAEAEAFTPNVAKFCEGEVAVQFLLEGIISQDAAGRLLEQEKWERTHCTVVLDVLSVKGEPLVLYSFETRLVVRGE